MAISRFDIDSAVDRLMFKEGIGHLMGLPTRPGTSSAATTGVPTNGIVGFAPGALFYNFKGSPGSLLYVNMGTNASAQWMSIDSPDGSLIDLITTTTLTAILNGGRVMMLDLAGGFTTTLPAATGTGLVYTFIVKTVSTTGYLIAAVGSDVYKGEILVTAAGATPGSGCSFVSTTNQTITLNGTTKGGVAIGDQIVIRDLAAGVWQVQGWTIGSGTLATPFS
jgi:hypothetical protein